MPLRGKSRRGARSRTWLLLLPFLGGSLLLIGLPIALTCALAFYRYDGLSQPVWQGTLNFTYVFRDPLFSLAAQNSLLLTLAAVPLRMLGALALALLLLGERRGTVTYRATAFLPTIMPDVAYAFIWLWIFNPLYGPLNVVLGAIGLPPPQWLADPQSALWAIVIMASFQVGEGFVLLLAALKQTPREYYDAGAIDGASRWQSFRYITLPVLAPWLLLLAARDVALTTQSTFVAAYLMTGGGPYYATFFLPLLIHEEAFDRLRFGTASAMTALVLGAVAGLVLLVYLVMRGWDDAARS